MTSSARCPGCHGAFDAIEGPTHACLDASPGCWAAYGIVLAREYEDPPLFADVHRISVDACAAQHPGKPSTQTTRSVGMHLVRLLVQLERGGGAKANAVMLALDRDKHGLTWLEPPDSPGAITVAHVVPRVDPEEHRAAVLAWGRSVLDAWSPHRKTIERWADQACVGNLG